MWLPQNTYILSPCNPADVLISFPLLSGLIELTPIQQALIYSFCENHDKAISVLEGVTATRPDISTYALLAKAQMKAKKIKVKKNLLINVY